MEFSAAFQLQATGKTQSPEIPHLVFCYVACLPMLINDSCFFCGCALNEKECSLLNNINVNNPLLRRMQLKNS